MTQYALAPCFYIRVCAGGKTAFYANDRRNGRSDMKKLGDFDGTKEDIKAAEQRHASAKVDMAAIEMVPKSRRRKVD